MTTHLDRATRDALAAHFRCPDCHPDPDATCAARVDESGAVVMVRRHARSCPGPRSGRKEVLTFDWPPELRELTIGTDNE